MQLVIKNGKVISVCGGAIKLRQEQYPGCEIVFYDGDAPLAKIDSFDFPDDPRTAEEKRQVYRSRRKFAYPDIGDQLDMMYWDKVNGTTTWQQAVAVVKARYPKP